MLFNSNPNQKNHVLTNSDSLETTARAFGDNLFRNAAILAIFYTVAIGLVLFLTPLHFHKYWVGVVALLPIVYNCRTRQIDFFKVDTLSSPRSPKKINGTISTKLLGLWTMKQSDLVDIKVVELYEYDTSDTHEQIVLIHDIVGNHVFGGLSFAKQHYQQVSAIFEQLRQDTTLNHLLYHDFSTIRKIFFVCITGLMLYWLSMPFLLPFFD